MLDNKVIINYDEGFVSVADHLLTVSIKGNRKPCVKMTTATCVPAQSEMIISVSAPFRFEGKTVFIEGCTDLQFKRFAVARSFGNCKNGQVDIKVLNFNPYALVLGKKSENGFN